MSKSLCPEYLVRISEALPLEIDQAGVGWLGHIPIVAGIVKRWEAAGLIEDYGVDSKILTAKGAQFAREGH